MHFYATEDKKIIEKKTNRKAVTVMVTAFLSFFRF